LFYCLSYHRHRRHRLLLKFTVPDLCRNKNKERGGET
jgi:hypothetical protein